MVKGKGLRRRFGDTLIEVTIAIGIFSMVVISAVSVINVSTSGTQNILENTLTREYIDSQAEALRFIQAAYTAEGEINSTDPTKYASLWDTISARAISLDDTNTTAAVKNIITNYAPATCSELYNTDSGTYIGKQNAFLLNINAMGLDFSTMNETQRAAAIKQIIITPEDSAGKFIAASTYPRIVYGSTSTNNSLYNPGEASDIMNGVNFGLTSAEGLFIVPVKDSAGTVIVSDDTGAVQQSVSAYIDFYIRSCWFATGAERPSTISTVIRLYNPDAIAINKYQRKGIIIRYDKNASDATGTMPSQYVLSGKTVSLLQNRFDRNGFKFMGWNAKDSSGNTIATFNVRDDGTYDRTYTAPTNLTENQTITMQAIWQRYYTITYYNTDGKTIIRTGSQLSWNDSHTFSILSDSQLNPTKPAVSQTGNTMELLGWSENKNGSGTLYNSKGTDGAKTSITATAPDHTNLKLYPVWRERITFTNVQWIKRPSNSSLINLSNNGSITLTGVRRPDAKAQAYLEVDKDDTFELTANLTTSGIIPHPEGIVGVSIGPLVAVITKDNNNRLIILYGYLPLSRTFDLGDSDTDVYWAFYALNTRYRSGTPIYKELKNYTPSNSGSEITLKITKYGGTYTMSVNGEEVKIETRENGNGTYNVLDSNGGTLDSGLNSNQLSPIRVVYTMKHTSHSCSSIFRATLYNIKMTTSGIYYDTSED